MTFLLRDFITKIQEMFICLPKKEIFTRHTEKNIPIIYRRPYPWYIVFEPVSMVFWCPTHSILTPLIHGILTHLPMVYWPPYPWYFDPSGYLLIRNEGVQFSIREGAIYHGWKLTLESIYHGGQNIIWHRPFLHSSISWPITEFVTILTRVPLVEQEQPTFPEHPSSPRFLVGFVLLDL